MVASTEPRESVVRFDLAVQKSHLFVAAAALVVSLVASALDVFPLRVDMAIYAWLAATAIALLFHELFRRRLPRNVLNTLWLTSAVIFVTVAVFGTGGVHSPWYL